MRRTLPLLALFLGLLLWPSPVDRGAAPESGVTTLSRGEAGVGLIAIVALVLANAFFVAAEFSLVGARKTRLDQMSREGNRKARLARRAISSLDRYISA